MNLVIFAEKPVAALAATLRSFAHMLLMFSDRNKIVLWPGCEGRARCSLFKNNMQSLRFIQL